MIALLAALLLAGPGREAAASDTLPSSSVALDLLFRNLDDRIGSAVCGEQFRGKPGRALLVSWIAGKNAADGTDGEFSVSCEEANLSERTKGWACTLALHPKGMQGGALVWRLTRDKRFVRGEITCVQ
jgi:hypothetical protein